MLKLGLQECNYLLRWASSSSTSRLPYEELGSSSLPTSYKGSRRGDDRSRRENCPMIYNVRALFTALAVSVASPAADDWLRPLLPSTLRPVNYDLWLCPELNDGAPTTYRGRVDIAVEVLSVTTTVIVHVKDINITFTALTDHNDNVIPVSICLFVCLSVCCDPFTLCTT